MTFHIGKLVSGPKPKIPKFIFFGGMCFINWLSYSLIINIPDFIIKFADLLGIDLIGN